MKTCRLARILLTVAGLLPGFPLWAQWHDSFDAGLEEWQGMKDCFEIVEGQLRSKGPEKSSRIGLSRAFEAGDSTLCFEFGIDLGFVPSSTNRLRLYLFGTDSALSDTAAAIYLQLGQKGGINTWEMYQVSADTLVSLWQGERVYSKQNQMKFNLRVVYRPCMRDSLTKSDGKSGDLQVFHSTGDPAQAFWQADGGRVRATVFPMADRGAFYTGLMGIYQTASRFDKYAFDYVSVGRLPLAKPVISDIGGMDKVNQAFCMPVPHAGSLVINEILFNPRSGESRFVEIHNPTDTVWELRQLALGIPDGEKWRYSLITKDTTLRIEAHSWKAVAKEAKTIGKAYRGEPANIFTANAFPTIGDKAGRLRLVWIPAAADTVRDTVFIDEVAYSAEWHHWLLPDPEGVSLERLRADKSGMEASNWVSAAETAGFATPGTVNSQVYVATSDQEPVWFTLDPPVVTPNNDARNDFMFLRWNPALAGCMCSICVYDERGRKIKTLAHELLLGAGGEIRYDATDAGGRILRPGIYVVYIDLLRSNGRHKRLRYPLVVG